MKGKAGNRCNNLMKKIIILLFLPGIITFAGAQSIDKLITPKEAERIEQVLSADDMQGRKIFTPAADKAADFIANEFQKNGLQYFDGLSGYRQEFTMLKPKPFLAETHLDGEAIESKNIIAFTTEPDLSITDSSGYEKVRISGNSNFGQKVYEYFQSEKNLIVIVDTAFSKNFSRIASLSQESFKRENNVVFILSAIDPARYDIHIKNELTEVKLSNVIGILPGKTRKDEYVIFSAHYDHLGIGEPDASADSIYNGANDDASGTTAVIMLSEYFGKLANNERTLVFVAFTGEESGGYGSTYFSGKMDGAKAVAMFNIEMIGTESKWGRNSAYITGYERSDFGKILQAGLAGSKFNFEPDPYPAQKLFFRSDNARLASRGVPAHTISTSKMDNEPNYHKQSDEIATLDIHNMAEIIKAIAISAETIISGRNTPSRVVDFR